MEGFTGLGIFGLTASIGVGLIFLVSGGAKLRHRAVLSGVIVNYRILPPRLVSPTAAVLPYLEIAVGAALITGVSAAPVIVAITLLLAFAAAIAVNIHRGRSHIDCGCGLSALRQPLSHWLVARNLMLASLLALRLVPPPALSGAEVSAATVGGVALFVCYLIFNTIGSLSQTSATAFRR